jgi:hypothetical protein
MKHTLSLLVATCLISSLAVAGTSKKEPLVGKYMEARTCDVFTAACFANSEVNMNGKEAIMAWQVTHGTQHGVKLDGLTVVAVVRANSTLGDTAANPLPARAIVYVDAKADAVQQKALISLAQEMGKDLISDVVRVEVSPISMKTDRCTVDTCGSLKVGDVVALELRSMHDEDKKCGNDEAFYKPLTDVSMPMAHFTKYEKFADKGLGVTWNDSGRRGAYVANFSK